MTVVIKATGRDDSGDLRVGRTVRKGGRTVAMVLTYNTNIFTFAT